MKQTFDLNFSGYFGKERLSELPEESGIYAVFRGVQDRRTFKWLSFTLLYIGQASDLRERLTGHEGWSAWERRAGLGSSTVVSYAPLPKTNLDRVEAALIFCNQPMLNSTLKDNFNYHETTVRTSGNRGTIRETNNAG